MGVGRKRENLRKWDCAEMSEGDLVRKIEKKTTKIHFI
jgi:hypothetical protein